MITSVPLAKKGVVIMKSPLVYLPVEHCVSFFFYMYNDKPQHDLINTLSLSSELLSDDDTDGDGFGDYHGNGSSVTPGRVVWLVRNTYSPMWWPAKVQLPAGLQRITFTFSGEQSTAAIDDIIALEGPCNGKRGRG